MSKTRTISSLLTDPKGPYCTLIERTRLYNNLESHLMSLLEPGLAAHCRIQALREGCLHLQTDAPSWAARLRFELPRLLECLRAFPGLHQLKEIRIRVIPSTASRPIPARPARLSHEAAAILNDAAEAVGDPQLREALKRLARRGQN